MNAGPTTTCWTEYPEESRKMQCGDWEWVLRGTEIADLSFRGWHVLRSVRAIVRDHDWNTPDVIFREVTPTGTGATMRISVIDMGASFEGSVAIEVSEARCTVTFEVTAAREFHTNRTGLVVLHGPQLAGAPLTVTQTGGEETRTEFPVHIAPHQPVRDVRALKWDTVVAGVCATFRADFTGDVFEMEDQRNWTDASFKTYSRPLDWPFPYRIAPGECVRQSITIDAVTVPDAPNNPEINRIELRPQGVFPSVGTSAGSGPDPAPDVRLPVNHVLVELNPLHANWRAALERAAKSFAPLDVRIVYPGTNALLEDVVHALSAVRIVRIGVFDRDRHVTLPEQRDALVAALTAAGIRVPIVGGSRAHFTEYNREYDAIPQAVDGVTYSLTPLFHDLSTAQLEESVAMQRVGALQAVRMAAPLPVHVGPITLRPRFNNVATSPQPAPVRSTLDDGYGAEFTGSSDPRQDSPEMRAWTAASVAALAGAGVSSLSYFEEWGPRGICDEHGNKRAIAEVLALAASWSGQDMLVSESPDDLVWAVGVHGPRGARVLLAYLGDRTREIEVVRKLPQGDVDGADERGRIVQLAARTMAVVEID